MDAPSITYRCVLEPEADGSVGAIPVPFDQREFFGKARPPVVVAINGHSYRSTIAIMNGVTFVPLRRSNREAAGVKAGDTVEVTLTLDMAPRVVAAPDDLVRALAAAGCTAAWDALAYTHQREHAEAVESAKRPETRARRIAAILSALAPSRFHGTVTKS